MSSEMRELVRKWKFNLRLLGPDVARRVLESCIADVDALLARTEAGADGDKGPWRWKRTGSKVDVYSDDFTHDVALRIDGDFASEADADVYAAWLAGRLNTHPQDASGDAEMLDWLDRQAADGVHVEVCCTGNFDARTIARKATVYVGRPQSEHEAASVRDAIRNAMQAKEAK